MSKETQLSKIQAVFSKDILIVRSHEQKLLLSVFQKPFSNKMSERHWLNLDLVPMKQLCHPNDWQDDIRWQEDVLIV